MRYLVLSDLHANLEALEAVLREAAGRYDRVLCCGDLVGYGADPNAVVDWVRANAAVAIRGNHDKAAVGLEDLDWFNPVAQAAAVWTYNQLSAENAAYVRALPAGPIAVEGFQVAHGSPLDEDEYIIAPGDAGRVFGYLHVRVTFMGHTHLQGGFIGNRARIESIGAVGKGRNRQLLDIDPDCAYLVNPGSVGQPRDGDARAGYVLYDPADHYLCYHRVSYEVEKSRRKIHEAGLPPLLGDRLLVGR